MLSFDVSDSLQAKPYVIGFRLVELSIDDVVFALFWTYKNENISYIFVWFEKEPMNPK